MTSTTFLRGATERDIVGRPPMSRRGLRAAGIAVGALAVAGVVGGALWFRDRPPAVVTATSGPALVQGSTGGIGTVEPDPASTYSLTGSQFFPIGPVTVSGVDVVPGQAVKVGQPLLSLDAPSVTGSLTVLKDQIVVTQNELRVIVSSGTTAEDQVTEAQLRSQIALLQQEEQLALGNPAVITSPIAGRVLSVGGEAGTLVANGKTLVQVDALATSDVSFGVPLTTLATVAIGQRAVVTFPGLPGVQRVGRVISIDPRASNGGLDGTVIASFRNGAGQPMPVGAEATVTVQDPVRAAVAVPTLSIIDAQLSPAVYVIDHGVARLHPVQIGASDGRLTQVLSGLAPGARVAISNLQVLQTGTHVR